MKLLLDFVANPDNEWIWHLVQATLVIIGFYLVSRQLRLARDQNSISHLNYFREVWNSEPLLRARLAVAERTVLESSDFEGYEDVLVTFMEDLGAAISVGQVNTEHVWRYYSYYIDGYWLLLNPKVTYYRERTSDPIYFEGFEELHNLSARVSRQHGTFPMLESYLSSFRKEEIKTVRFLLGSDLLPDNPVQ
ncbi:hypothetical protein [Sulfitobacter aestuariivivens]|uniref:DUF4760 domain-containing protein n=1 Tax=Sulfitobacter aestuariivivens TaxID=2766981 RepID=A0A927HD89_9RHOB|nr:hypothetical protein [Sulfitobacter aestuariivivens]MBD3663412.1 hypothetical protein [Sulfitobacter aestuariivivens]